ncbi:L-type lectin-domain containing receptor kinase IX.1 [Acorus calamus]|uniref:non-specific serine/threonine protein kinase n=1 Tax=Acorus calamus TaxID=4465 RepID=A0AAV9CZ05_ACOCL|nr:L-type lectin-domain containing receptor kinase IX.1 [Acorus calamus]
MAFYIYVPMIFLFFHFMSSANSLHFNFSRFDQNSNDIIKVGDASASGGSIELTRNKIDASSLSGSSGRAIFNQTVPIWHPMTRELTDFTTHFTFSITAVNTTNPNSGDGLTFFLAPNGSTVPDASEGGCLSLVSFKDKFNSSAPFVAVEFDTYPNLDWDPLDGPNHIGIDINSIRSVKNVTWDYRFDKGEVANAWVVYSARLKRLSVYLTYEKDPIFDAHNVTLSYDVDLRDILPEQVNVGLSATTGASTELHSVRSWVFNSTLNTPANTTSTLAAPAPQVKSRSQFLKNAGAVGGVTAAVIVLGVVWYLVWVMKSRRQRGATEDDDGDIEMDEDMLETERGPRRFPYSTLAAATNNFNVDQKLGEGGFGEVHRGFLRDLGLDVAVKKVSASSTQGKKEYLSEVNIISRLRHRNLVQLIGYCHNKGRFLLVYELVPNGSLESHLFGSRGSLSFADRHKIALGLASALLYLHEEWTQCVLHRDIKTSNVMLDSNFEAKLGDFGLARLVDHDQNLQTTDVAGTRGYLAPECYYTSKASCRESDVYSFGVVVLEIGCGRKAIDFKAGEGKVELVKWVWELYGTGKVIEAVDERLGTDYRVREMERLMIVGLWCAHPDYLSRPSIRQAIGVLKSEAPLPELPWKLPVPVFLVPTPSTGLSMSSYTASSSSGAATDSTSSSAFSYNVAQ